VYEVVVKGGLIGRLKEKDYGKERRSTVAYAFEMLYRRMIESNDGYRVVERRCYEYVRMAKIVSPEQDLRCDLGPPGATVLDAIQFPAPGAGIIVAPVRQVAETILSSGVLRVAKNESSRAFLEQDALSGKTVRLAYVDGVGVEAIAPLDWRPTVAHARYLLTEPVLAGCYFMRGQNAKEAATWKVNIAQLASFLDPTVFFDAEESVVVKPSENGAPNQYSILRPFLDCGEESIASDDRRLSPCALIGTFTWDPIHNQIASATVTWQVRTLVSDREQLLFEDDFQDWPVLTVSYSCTVK